MPKSRPFLKWAGNKYRCLNHIISKFPDAPCLIEPFAGSAAISLNSNYSKYILGEKNPYLIDLYQHVKIEGIDFIKYCHQWFKPEYNQAEQFYRLRTEFNHTQDKRLKSALFLYLNRHGFNGLCRFNRKGIFNVPFGSYTKPYFPHQEMLHFHEKAKQTTFMLGDFEQCFQLANPGDILYCDPPYHPISKTANFTMYINSEFNAETQIKLAELAMETSKKGVHVFISNHDTPFTRQVYEKAKQIDSFEVSRTIAGIGHKRVKVKEILAYFKPK
jgi:DNA adenine methylase